MDCHQARQQIDQRLQEQAQEDANGGRDWSELDAHLAGCPKCSADWLELLRTRKLLAPLADEAPTRQETDSMWQAIQSAAPAAVAATAPARRRAIYRYVAACAGIAAVLFIAFQVATIQYGLDFAWPKFTQHRGVGALTRGDRSVSLESDRRAAPATARVREESGAETLTPDEIRRLESLGYMGLPRDVSELSQEQSPTQQPDRTRAFWDLVQSGEVTAKQYLSPSSDDSNGDWLAATDEGRRFADLGRVSYGYGVPRADKGDDQLGSTVVSADFVRRSPPTPPSLVVPAETGEGEQTVDHARLEVRFDSLEGAVTSGGYGTALASGGGGAGGGATRQQMAEPPPSPTTPKREPKQPSPDRAPTQPQAKIIKTGELSVEVTDYDAAVERIEAVVREHGGFVADGSTQEGSGAVLIGRVVIRVLPERFEALFAALKTVGRVESENVKAADVTAEYVDLEARIASLRITEQRLQELVKSKSIIDKISSLLEVERELTRVRSQIEQLQGQLRVMADRVAMSTITMTFREPARTVPSASMSVEVPILSDAADALGEILGRLDGRVTSGKTSKRDDGTLRGDYRLYISLARFGELLEAVESLGRVEERQVTDQQFGDLAAPWAQRVKCFVGVVLFERSRPLPTGTMRIEVDALDAALEVLNDVLAGRDGSITSNKTTRRDDGSHVGELKLSVPAGRFAELIDGLTLLGRTTAKQVAGEAGQIVGGAASVLCDLSLTLAERPREVPVGHMAVEVDEFAKARDSLIELVDRKSVEVLESSSSQRNDGTWVGAFRLGVKAGEMEDVVAWLESLGKVRSRRITGLGLGDLSRIDPDALGTIGLALAEKAAISPEPERAGGSIRGRLRDGLAGLYTSLGLILYGLVVFAPWLIIVLILAWVITRLRRKRPVAVKREPGA